MGENFSTTIYTLKDHPELRPQTVQLIEKSFNYQPPYSFFIDFFPLMSPQNGQHNHILVYNNEVVAHIGCLKKEFSGSHPVLFIGGIAVSEEHRGKGLFKKLFSYILQLYKEDISLFFLWSDKSELYQKFNFSLAIGQIAPTDRPFDLESFKGFEKRQLNSLTADELQEIQDLYNAMAIHYTIVERDEEDWQQLLQITSADIFIQRDEEQSIQAYFIINKGFDLKNIIHEVAFLPSIKKNFLKKLSKYNLWLPETESTFYSTPVITYMALIQIGNIELFKTFINDWSNNTINITSVEQDKITFIFKEEEFSATHAEFFQYIWGPYPLSEFEDIGLPLYISGLDSI